MEIHLARRRASYGIDSPGTLFGFACALISLTVGAVIGERAVIRLALTVFALCCAGSVALYLYATKSGKFRVWSEILDEVFLRGDERVLDLGCGRGAVLIAAARRLRTGRVVGIDLWRTQDQSGNAESRTVRNAAAEGVADRIELCTGDLRRLPFADSTFDVVLSSLAMHNIMRPADRVTAIDEAVRVLRPGGRVFVADILGTAKEYRRRLTELGMTAVRVRPLGWRMWFGGPWVRTKLVTAVKPF
ncbi:MAG TPA: class I SAM-dependent methyltransferase [Amycolatopsis sp.]|nr:class I SAM-dependent methyltransferase [Amycolatopsis sp.]